MNIWKRRLLASVGAVFSGLMFVIKPLMLHKFKVYTRTQLSMRRPTSLWMSNRMLSSSRLHADSIYIEDVIGDTDEWKKQVGSKSHSNVRSSTHFTNVLT